MKWPILFLSICVASVSAGALAQVVLPIATGVATPSEAIAPAPRNLADLVQRGYMIWDDRTAMVLYEARRRGNVDNDLVLRARGSNLHVAADFSAGLKQAMSRDEFAREAARPVYEKWLAQLRSQASASKGVVWEVVSRAGDYDFERQFFPMKGDPGFGARPNFPGGGSCAGPVDAIKTSDPWAQPGRRFCLYTTNINLEQYQFEVKDRAAAQKFANLIRMQWATMYLTADFDGPSYNAVPENAAAGIQPMRVTGMHAVDNQGQIIASAPYQGEGLTAVYRGPSTSLHASDPAKETPSKPKPLPPASPLPMPIDIGKSTNKRPIVIDVKP